MRTPLRRRIHTLECQLPERQILGILLEAPIPKMSGLVRKHDLFSKAFIFPNYREVLSPKLILGI